MFEGASSSSWPALSITIQNLIVSKFDISNTGTDLAAAVSFLLQLGFRPPGAPLRLESLPLAERRIAAALAQLGLLCPFRCCNNIPAF